MIEETLPELKPGEVLIDVAASAISPGTELGGFRGREVRPEGEERRRSFGYQNSGRVIGVGDGVDEFSIGQRVAAMGASYAEHGTAAIVPVNLTVPLPDEVSFEEGAFIALEATALNAVRRAQLELGEYVVVMGLGLVGQMAVQLSRLAGANVLGVDRLPLRVDTAKSCGFADVVGPDDSLEERAASFTHGEGADAALICFGGDATEAFKQLVKLMKKSPDTHVMGRVVIPGGAQVTHGFGAALGNMDIRSAARTGPGYHDPEYELGKDYPGVFVRWDTQRNLKQIMRWIVEGRLKVKELITHRVTLEEAPAACREIIEHPENTLGVVLRMK